MTKDHRLDAESENFRLRSSFPKAASLLMDRETLMAHSNLWGQEPAIDRFAGELSRLTETEQSLFSDLKLNRLGR